jgi:ABC-2 type transport system ATP-binding protein
MVDRVTAPAIEVNDLVVRYRTTVAVNAISFEARSGEVVALLGPNGAGKTSTVETLEGYRRPTVGSVRVLGLDPRKDHKALTRRIGVMLQRGGVYPSLSPRDAVRLFAEYYDESEEPEGLLYRVGLVPVADTPWRRLSGGEQQRLSLALAIVGRPWVAFLDEPTAGVDPQGRQTIRGVINDLRAAGACVLVTTHEMQEAELCDRVIILDRGRIVADGTPTDLMVKEAGKEIRFGAPAGLDTVALGEALAAAVDEVRAGEYLVHAEGTPATIAALTAWLAARDLALADLRAGRQRLEDVFLRLTSNPGRTEEAARPMLAAAPAPSGGDTAGVAGADEGQPLAGDRQSGNGGGRGRRGGRVPAGQARTDGTGSQARSGGTETGGRGQTGSSDRRDHAPTGSSDRGDRGQTGSSDKGEQAPTGSSDRGDQAPTGSSDRGDQAWVGTSDKGDRAPTGATETGGRGLTEGTARDAGVNREGGHRPPEGNVVGGGRRRRRASRSGRSQGATGDAAADSGIEEET